MENKEQSSLEKDNCVGSSAFPCSYKCCQEALADQKRKIFSWFHNWLIQKELNMKLKDWSSTELKRDFDKEF